MQNRVAALVAILSCNAALAQAPPLLPDASNEQIVAHLRYHEAQQTTTDALARHFPNLDRERAYEIQWTRLEAALENARQAGWKLGWTRKTDDGAPLDPILGHYMPDRVYAEDEDVSAGTFTGGTAFAEPEIVFYLDRDLPGPHVTRADVMDAVGTIGIAMEFVNWRVEEPRTREHAIADNGIAAGVVLADGRFAPDDVDFSAMTGTVTVNDEDASSGPATSIMGVDPVAGVVWAANELIRYGRHLEAGQFVVSGTVAPPLPVSAGDRAEVRFDGLGSLLVRFVD